MISTIHPIPAFTDNYIWAIHETESRHVCVVDPGDAQPVIEYLESNGLQLTDILITHHHADHTGGIQELTNRYSCRVLGPSSSGIKGVSEFVSAGDTVTLFGQSFSVIEVPGHTLDHIAYHCEDKNQIDPILLCGDTLFAAGCGRLFEGTAEMMHESLHKLSTLPASTKVYCTHEYTLANLKFAIAADPENVALIERIELEKAKRAANLPTLPSSIELELATNPFLRCSEPKVQESTHAHSGLLLSNDVEVFAALRAWKDSF
ncbi:MAG: hydroxyacylglutathione hydrolase [Gammaproteobacteria bacterium]|nr:hydroxyacylglutathione hydrolase [Gammaproteobacteria bacterium]